MGQVIYLPAARMEASISNNSIRVSSFQFRVLESRISSKTSTAVPSCICLTAAFRLFAQLHTSLLAYHYCYYYYYFCCLDFELGISVKIVRLSTFPEFRFLLASLGSRQGRSFPPTDPNRMRNSSAPNDGIIKIKFK